MATLAFRNLERFSTLNAEIALMDVANRDESLDRSLLVLWFNHDDQVYLRLRWQARHSG
jgi:hypothetical protein